MTQLLVGRTPWPGSTLRIVLREWNYLGNGTPNRQAFAAMDRLVDQTHSGPFHLSQTAVAETIVGAIHHNADAPAHYY